MLSSSPGAVQDLATLRHPLVRDLAWLLHAPDILRTSFAGRPSLTELGLADPQRRRHWLSQLEVSPQALETLIDPGSVTRLGHYHERLWQFLLAHAPGTRLLAHNLTIRQHKQTLGELDLLYARRDGSPPVHLELAIKYYLGLPEGPGNTTSQARWIGPGCADSLALKRTHALWHQLPLATRPEAAEALQPFDAPPLTSRLAMLGVLFQPWRAEPAPWPLPDEVDARALLGEWLPVSAWPAFCQQHEDGGALHGAFLAKPHWLAPPVGSAFVDAGTLGAELAAHFTRFRAPRQLVLRQGDATFRRLFVVDDGWPHTVPLPPQARRFRPAELQDAAAPTIR